MPLILVFLLPALAVFMVMGYILLGIVTSVTNVVTELTEDIEFKLPKVTKVTKDRSVVECMSRRW
jgi:hypothetical protein